ncbi:hypothetical protein I41_27270 [Lacipirellula limnantheis]|uniref:Uncharacterized protein n=2 Tax=Lacipirellula limnantheis TaxID=2528024 RepID=A0A517TYU0_9BACT|nr:hypothetical protein I41_27270 [Lacipirellula limnantheis]
MMGVARQFSPIAVATLQEGRPICSRLFPANLVAVAVGARWLRTDPQKALTKMMRREGRPVCDQKAYSRHVKGAALEGGRTSGRMDMHPLEIGHVEISMNPFNAPIEPLNTSGSRRRTCISPSLQALHRISEVMETECVGVRTAAERMNLSMSQVRAECEPSCDLRLSELYRWQAALRVPVGELLNEPVTDLSPAVAWRGRMLKVMRTARSIEALTDQECVHSLAMILVQSLEALMPELDQVPAWPLQGQPRTGDELGVAADRRLSEDFFDTYVDG